jgi:flagellar biosynthesis GTPase FlhF
MDIKTFRASSMQEALKLVRRELGPEAAVLRTREVRAGGMLGLLTGERGIEIEASTEVIVPSRLPKRPTILDQGLDLTEMAQIRMSVEHERFEEPANNQRTEPFHLVVAGAGRGVGSTTVATNLAAALNSRRVRASVWSGESRNDRLAGNQSSQASADVLILDVGSRPAQQFDRLWEVAGLVLLVVSPETSSILDAYAAIKHLAARQPAQKIQTIVNFARDASEGERVHRQLAQTCRQFLNLEVSAAGFVMRDDAIPRTMQNERSVVVDLPHGTTARQFEQITSQLELDLPINYLRYVSRKNLKNAETVVPTGRY